MNPLYLAAVLVAESSGVTFHTHVEPRVDPVFGDVISLRRSLDRFLAVDTEMQQVADQFSVAVHATLAELAKAATKDDNQRGCPSRIAVAYDRARAAGTQYLALGRELDQQMHEIRSAETYGDTVALTPDYRAKVEKARRDHVDLLRELREMQVAFHDQLESEMHYAGCSTASLASADLPTTDEDVDQGSPDPAPPAQSGARPTQPSGSAAPTAPIASAVVDSSHCSRPSRLTVDGQALGPIEGGRRTLVRLPQGPHSFCVLPASDERTCETAGALRRAYVHDGWVLEVRCEK